MRDASKPVPPQPKQADIPDDRPPVLRLCALFVAMMATVHTVQSYGERQQIKNQEASASDTCMPIQQAWQHAVAPDAQNVSQTAQPIAGLTITQDGGQKVCTEHPVNNLTPIS